MADDGFLHGIPEVMEAFNPQSPQVQFGGGAAGGGGMAEAIAFTGAHEQAKNAFQQYVQSATEGFAAYRDIAVRAANSYRAVDERARGRYQGLGVEEA